MNNYNSTFHAREQTARFLYVFVQAGCMVSIMGVFEKYFRKEFQVRMLYLEHDEPSDFYLSSCQNNGSVLPLLILRAVVFIACFSIFVASVIVTSDSEIFLYLPIFLTTWGLVLITLTSGCALMISLRAFFGGPIDPPRLPLYVKIYWALFNTAVPITFFITLFYWSLLTKTGLKYTVNPIISIMVHGVNAILILALLLFSRQPSHLLHCIYPLIVASSYTIFTLVYYFAGGTNQNGSRYIYPMMDWSNPSIAVTTVIGSVPMLLIIQMLIVLTSTGRNWLVDRYWRKRSMDIIQVR